MVYAMTNQLNDNQVVAYHQASDGTLTGVQTIDTGGGGSGTQLDGTDSLGSAYSLLVDHRDNLLFAVNTNSASINDGVAGTDCATGTISSFTIGSDGTLTLVGTYASGGLFPSSLTTAHGLLYVLNAGGPGGCGIGGPNITGFKINSGGLLSPLSGSTQSIDPGPVGTAGFLNCDPSIPVPCGLNPPAYPRSPAEVAFAPDGSLVVTVKGTNMIDVFPVKRDGTPGTPTTTQIGNPNQPTPFGFTFTSGSSPKMILTEPFGESPTIPHGHSSALASYQIGSNGTAAEISTVGNAQTASCWVAIEARGLYAYVANNGSADISIYSIASDGTLTLLNGSAVVGDVMGPNDLVTKSNSYGEFLYVLSSGSGTVAEFKINTTDGSLTSLGNVAGLPMDAGAQGLAG